MPDEPTAAGPVVVASTPPVRVSHADRSRTIAHLQAACGEGRLELDETDERVTAAFTARYERDLEALVADLPPHVPVGEQAPAWDAVWASAVWRARVVVLGPAAGGHAPTVEQRRAAAALAVLAVLWFVMCAFAGAALVA